MYKVQSNIRTVAINTESKIKMTIKDLWIIIEIYEKLSPAEQEKFTKWLKNLTIEEAKKLQSELK
jgi:hypothetical protein